MLKNLLPLVAVLSLGFVSAEALAVVPALDASTAVAYLEDNAGTNMSEVGVVVFTLAGLAMAITWVKATFFG